MQQNSKCRLCGDRDETLNYIRNECNKLTQKVYKTKHDWGDKVIVWELCKKFKFDHTKMLYAQLGIHPCEWDAQHALVFWDKNG